MGIVKGKVQAAITLSSSTCYYMLTGQCSLDIVTDYYLSPSVRTSANELLYCPRLYRAMCSRERMKPITVTPCDCGHAEVISGHQRACIASQKNLELMVQPTGKKVKASCPVCSGQITFDESQSNNRLVSLNIHIHED